MYPNDFVGVDARQNAARVAVPNAISEITGTAAESANNAGNQMFKEGSLNYNTAKVMTGRAYAARDPFNEARVGLPVQHVDDVVSKYFGEGSGGAPSELAGLVNDIRRLGTVTEDPAIAQGFKDMVERKTARPSASRGTPVMSAIADAENLAARRGAFDDMPDEYLKPLESPGAVNLDTLQNLRSRASEMAYKASLSGDKRLSSSAGQIADHLDGALEAAAGRSAVGQVLADGVDVPQAMYRKGIGEIDFRAGHDGVWNPKKGRFEGGEGINHVVSQRSAKDGQDGVAVAMSLPDVLAHGQVGAPYGPEGAKRVNVALGDSAQAVLSQSDNGKWLLTGWNDGIGTSGGRDVVRSPSAYTPNSSVIQNSAGADVRSSIGVPGEYFKPDMAQAQRAARQVRTDQGNRFETGFAGRMWVDGADGMPKLTGGEIPRAAFNSGATQAQDIAQWGLMGRPGEDALKNYAITGLMESAAPNGMLSADKFGKWTRGRSEAIKGLFSEGEQGALAKVNQDLQRAAAADALERVRGQSNTAEKLTSLGLLDNGLTDMAMKALAHLPAVGGLVGAGFNGSKEAVKRWKYRDLPGALIDPEKALSALNVQGELGKLTKTQELALSKYLQQMAVPAMTSGD